MVRVILKPLAIAAAAIAILIWLTTTFPIWASHLILVVFGLVYAGQFARHYAQDPPSLARLEKLKRCGSASVIGLTLGTGNMVGQLISAINTVPSYLMPAMSFAVLLIGLFAISRWHSIAVRDFLNCQPEHLDFEEDAEGNPVPSAAPATSDEEVIETWDDLIRVQRKRRGLPATAEPPRH